MTKLKSAMLVLLIGAMLVPAPVLAQATNSYPNRPIQLVVPFPPGASTDLLARYLAPKLRDSLGQPVVVENRPGAGGTIGAAHVAKSAPDGHTLLVASSTVMQGPLLQKNPSFDPIRDLAPVAVAFQHPFLLAGNPTLPRSIPELIGYAKANPGKLNIASLGGFSDIMSEMFKKEAGVGIQIVPYRGAAEAIIGVIRGDSHLTFNPYSSMQAQITDGQLRMLAVTSLRRSPAIPDVATLAESGLPGFEIINVIGILAPAGTPQPILARLTADVTRIMSSPEGREFVVGRGNDTVEDPSPAYYAAYLKRADDKFKRVIDDIGFAKQ
jgi:tripartite-type tricarboxylate transporter receptor subunit TctC